MAILTQEQSAAMDAWAASQPAEFSRFFVRLNTKLGPSDDPEELLRRFQLAQPTLWTDLIATIIATYGATQSDVERDVGRAVLGTEPRRLEPVDEGESEVASDEMAQLQATLRTRTLDNRRLQGEIGDLRARIVELESAVVSEYARGVEDGASATTRAGQRANTIRALNAAIVNECQRAESACEVNGGINSAERVYEQLAAANFQYNARDFSPVLALLSEARRISNQNVAYPSAQSLQVALQLEA